MNGLIPGTGRFTPAGSGGAFTAALGNLTAAWAAETFLRVAKDRPATSPMAAAATVTPAVTRNERRSADAVTTGPPAPSKPAPTRAGAGPALPVRRMTSPGPRLPSRGPRPSPGTTAELALAPSGPRPGAVARHVRRAQVRRAQLVRLVRLVRLRGLVRLVGWVGAGYPAP